MGRVNSPSQLVMGRVFYVGFVFMLVAGACVGATGQESIAPRVLPDGSSESPGILPGYQAIGLDSLIREEEAAESDALAESAETNSTSEEVIPRPVPQAAHSSAMGLIWTVIGVDMGEVLNVRNQPDPDSTVIDQLAPWSNRFAATRTVEENGHGRWRLIDLPDGQQGWVNARFLVAQPLRLDEQSEARMVESVDSLVTWVLEGTDELPPIRLAEGALWVGGLGVHVDVPTLWTWVPASSISRRSGWDEQRTFDAGYDGCGSHCEASLSQFLHFGQLGPASRILVDDIATVGMFDGFMWSAPEGLHRAVVDRPNSEGGLDWQRIHFVFDWSSGKQRLALIHTHAWTP